MFSDETASEILLEAVFSMNFLVKIDTSTIPSGTRGAFRIGAVGTRTINLLVWSQSLQLLHNQHLSTWSSISASLPSPTSVEHSGWHHRDSRGDSTQFRARRGSMLSESAKVAAHHTACPVARDHHGPDIVECVRAPTEGRKVYSGQS